MRSGLKLSPPTPPPGFPPSAAARLPSDVDHRPRAAAGRRSASPTPPAAPRSGARPTRPRARRCYGLAEPGKNCSADRRIPAHRGGTLQPAKAPQKPPDLDQVRAIEPESSLGIFGARSQRLPEPVSSLSEMLGKALLTKVQESESHPRELGRRPGGALVLVADVTGIVEVEIVLGQARKKGLRTKVIQLEVARASGKQLVQQAVGTTLREVLPDGGAIAGKV